MSDCPYAYKDHAIKAYGGIKWSVVNGHTFLNLALDGSEWLASHPRVLNPGNYWATLN